MSEDAGKELAVMAPGFMEVLHASCEEKRKDKRAAARWQLGKSYKEQTSNLFRIYTGLGGDKFDALRKIDPERLCDILTRKALWLSIMKSPFLLAELAALFVPPIFLALNAWLKTGSLVAFLFFYLIAQAGVCLLWFGANLKLEDEFDVLNWLTRDVRYLRDRLRLSRSEAVKVLEHH